MLYDGLLVILMFELIDVLFEVDYYDLFGNMVWSVFMYGILLCVFDEYVGDVVVCVNLWVGGDWNLVLLFLI